MTEGVYSGTHTGVLATPQGDLLPTGRKLELRFRDVFQVKAGKAVAHRLYFDNVEFLTQLGLMPQPAKS
jgi:ketosteroid isomerase-like protein